MYGNIIFVGGIHGVGKSTVCKLVSEKIELEYLSASDVLKWRDIKPDYKDKNVEDIDFTQDRLILGLNEAVKKDKRYLLDGHFCLFNATGEVSRIPLKTFTEIRPILVCSVLGDPADVAQRLNTRDSKKYNLDMLHSMQEEGRLYGSIIARTLEIPYIEISNSQSHILEHNIQTLN